MSGFTNYIPGNSVMHSMNPALKLLLALIIPFCCFITANHLLIAALIGLSLLMGVLGGVAERTFKTFSGLCALSLFLFILQILSVGSGAVLLSLPFGLRITDAGLRFSSLICLRLIGATLPLTVVLTLTPVSAVTRALTDDLRIPFRYAFALTTAIRFIPLLSAQMSDVIEAQTARGVELDGGVFKKLALLPPLCVPILVSAVKRVERGAISAELRGFYLRPRGAKRERRGLRASDYAVIALCIALIALCVIV